MYLSLKSNTTITYVGIYYCCGTTRSIYIKSSFSTTCIFKNNATQDAQTAKDNLLSFVDRTVRQTDNVIQTEISQNRLIAGQYPLDDKLFTSVIAGYWDAPKDEKGNPNFLDPENYEFKNFYKRYGKIPDVVKYQTHKRRAGTEFNPNQTKTLVNPSTKLEEDLEAIERLYTKPKKIP